ncbi:MAG: MoxR family ATPase [Planctomycetota bacterium]
MDDAPPSPDPALAPPAARSGDAAVEAAAGVDGARDAVEHAVERIAPLLRGVGSALEGQSETIELSVGCLVAGGHLLLEDLPGTGKTTLARALALASGLRFRRVQMTADLLPADVTGARYPVLGSGAAAPGEPGSGGPAGSAPELRFVPGPLFSQVVLADELNRTPPRTQSALLEAMAEGHVTVEGERHDLPRPFFVVATQNPIEFAGTFPLPESQLDRFMMRLAPGYPGRGAERRMLRDRRDRVPIDELSARIETVDLLEAQRAVDRVVVAEPVEDYLLDVIDATRTSEEFALGASPRAALDLDRAARAMALLDGRDFVVAEDVRRLAVPVLAHRLVLRDPAHDGTDQRHALAALVDGLDAPRIGTDGTLHGPGPHR